MNERIRELAEQAGFNMEALNMYPGGFPREDLLILADFAELIIKECAESLWTEECYNSDLALEEFERNSAKIKKHFGVEE